MRLLVCVCVSVTPRILCYSSLCVHCVRVRKYKYIRTQTRLNKHMWRRSENIITRCNNNKMFVLISVISVGWLPLPVASCFVVILSCVCGAMFVLVCVDLYCRQNGKLCACVCSVVWNKMKNFDHSIESNERMCLLFRMNIKFAVWCVGVLGFMTPAVLPGFHIYDYSIKHS